MKLRVALCFLVGAAVAFVFYDRRGFFPQHAALVGLAVAAFSYSVLRAFDNLRRASGERAPRDHEQSQNE